MSVITTLLPRRAYRWNFTVMGLDFSIFLLGISFTSVYGVLPLFVSHLTASNLALGLIPAVRSVCTALPPILVAPYTERLRRKKPFLLGMTTFERLPYLALAVAIPLLAGAHPTLLLWLFFAMIGLGTLFGGIGMPAWIDLIARMLPADWRGRFFGLAAALGGLLGVAGAAGATALLQRYGWPTGFALCFAATSVCLAVSFVFIAAGREPAPARAAPTKGANRGYWRRLPGLVRADRNFARYLLATALITAAGMAASFYTVDAKRTLRLDDASAGAYAVVLLAASTVGNVLWGYAGDRIGHKRVVEGARSAPASPPCWPCWRATRSSTPSCSRSSGWARAASSWPRLPSSSTSRRRRSGPPTSAWPTSPPRRLPSPRRYSAACWRTALATRPSSP